MGTEVVHRNITHWHV